MYYVWGQRAGESVQYTAGWCDMHALQYIVCSPVEKLYTFVVKEDVLKELKKLTKAYLDEYLGKRFKSLEILETIVR